MNNEYKPSSEEKTHGRHLKETPAPERPEKPKKKKHTLRTVLIIVAAVLVVAVLAVLFVFRDLYSQMNTKQNPASATTAPTAAADTAVETTPEPTPSPSPTPEPLTEEELAALAEIQLKSSLQEEADEVMSDKNVYNILLIGSDSRSGELERSDSMILVSVNKNTKKIWVTSFMRDTQVTIPNWGTGHLNWATSIGGVDMLISALESEQNFAIDIDNWAAVDFATFVDVADLLAPITVTLSAEEVEATNGWIRHACQSYDQAYGLTGDDTRPRTYLEEGGGEYVLSDGAQILGYCRERYIGGDTLRSEKQRNALVQMWKNVKNMSLTEQYNLAKKVMSYVTTDMTMSECASLLLQAADFLTYDVEAQQCPVIGAFWKGRDADGLSIYNADFKVNRNFLRATIYGEEMSAEDLTSYWTGEAVQVYYPPETETGEDDG